MIVPKGLSSGVISSQILQMGKYQYAQNFNEVKVWLHKNDYKNQKGDYVELIIKRYTNVSEIKSRLKFGDSIYMRSFLDYCALFLTIKLKKMRSIYDFRGLLSHESFYKNKNCIKLFIIYLIEYFIYKTSKEIYCVSNEMKKLLSKQYGFRNINVRPSLTSVCIEKQSSLSIDKVLKFVYLGGTSRWQMAKETLLLYSDISKTYSSTLLIITNDEDYFNSLINQLKIVDSVIVKSVNQDEVHSLLKECDFGFLLRENHIINTTASPIKMLEYLGAGVIPIVSPYVGDYSEDVKSYSIGLVYRDGNKIILEIEEVLQNSLMYLKNIYSYCIQRTWDNYKNI
jgi:hypothetical protein